MVSAMPSWVRIMKTAITMTSVGAAERATRPVGVSPMVRCTSPPTAAAIANAIYDACGLRLRDLPLDRARIRDAR